MDAHTIGGSALSAFAEPILQRDTIVLADVGSIGGPHPRWSLLGQRLKVLLFDPRESQDSPIESAGEEIVHPVALSSAPGTETLHILKFGNMSSFLPPNRDLLRLFFKAGSRTEIVERQSLPVSTLDVIARDRDYAIDALKIDTQGSELAVLEGAIDCLSSHVVFAEIEVSFFERYVGQPAFADICSAMTATGFDLLDVYQMRRYQYRNKHDVRNIRIRNRQGKSGRLAYANALFVVSDKVLAKRLKTLAPDSASAMLRKLLAILAIYGKLDLAASLVDRHSAALRRSDIGKLFGAFIANANG